MLVENGATRQRCRPCPTQDETRTSSSLQSSFCILVISHIATSSGLLHLIIHTAEHISLLDLILRVASSQIFRFPEIISWRAHFFPQGKSVKGF